MHGAASRPPADLAPPRGGIFFPTISQTLQRVVHGHQTARHPAALTQFPQRRVRLLLNGLFQLLQRTLREGWRMTAAVTSRPIGSVVSPSLEQAIDPGWRNAKLLGDLRPRPRARITRLDDPIPQVHRVRSHVLSDRQSLCRNLNCSRTTTYEPGARSASDGKDLQKPPSGKGPNSGPEHPGAALWEPDLAELGECWPRLPESVRADIMAIARAAAPDHRETPSDAARDTE